MEASSLPSSCSLAERTLFVRAGRYHQNQCLSRLHFTDHRISRTYLLSKRVSESKLVHSVKEAKVAMAQQAGGLPSSCILLE